MTVRPMAGGRRSVAYFGVAVASLVTCGAPANAHDWTGFYLGGNAGYAWGQTDPAFNVDCPPTGFVCNTPVVGGSLADFLAINQNGSASLNPKGFTGGIQAGQNWQTNDFVYGLEADFGALDLSASRQTTFPTPANGGGSNLTTGSSIDTDWLMTARARLGWATSDLLFYATGGLALTRIEVTAALSDTVVGAAAPRFSGTVEDSELKVGWTAGGGVEWALSRNWSLKGEYLYVAFPSVSASGIAVVFPGVTSNPFSFSSDLDAHIVRAGINYKF